MNGVSELTAIIGKHLSWHKSRIDCFAQMLLALFTVKTVSLSELAVAMDSDTEIASRNKRLYRFFAHFTFDFSIITRWVFSLFFADSEKVYISIDRTNWFWGRSPINIFMLSVCYEGIAIPLLWQVMKQDGATTAKQQIELCERFISLFGTQCIAGLLGDREFTNEEFVGWLVESNIPFYLRLKKNIHVRIKGKKFKKSGELFASLSPFEQQVFGMRVEVFGQKLYLTASRNERDELMIILSNANYKAAVAIYLRRWEIENLFQALKGRGFRFEDTHVTKPERIEKMIVLLTIGLAWAHKAGEWRAEKKAIRFKIIKRQKRPQYTFFRYGLDIIRDAITGCMPKKQLLRHCLRCLEITHFETIS